MLVRQRRVIEALWILACSYLALSGARHIPVYAAAVAPLVALELTSWWQSWTKGKPRKSVAGILDAMAADLVPGFRRFSLFPVAAVAGLALVGGPMKWPADFPTIMFPTAMIHAHRSADSRLAYFHNRSVGRLSDLFASRSKKCFSMGAAISMVRRLAISFLHAISGAPDWEKIFERNRFDLALVPVDSAAHRSC